MTKLVNINKLPLAKQLASFDSSGDLIEYLIKLLTTTKNAKHAAQLVKDYKLDTSLFSELLELLYKATLVYYLSRNLQKKADSEEYMSLPQIEDILEGEKRMLALLVEELVNKNKYNDALGIYLRHEGLVQEAMKPDYVREMEDCRQNYDPRQDAKSKVYDLFGPLS